MRSPRPVSKEAAQSGPFHFHSAVTDPNLKEVRHKIVWNNYERQPTYLDLAHNLGGDTFRATLQSVERGPVRQKTQRWSGSQAERALYFSHPRPTALINDSKEIIKSHITIALFNIKTR
jgi:hypothetical protein